MNASSLIAIVIVLIIPALVVTSPFWLTLGAIVYAVGAMLTG